MTRSRIIDSHVHLWPAADANDATHPWMASFGRDLAKEHSLDNYLNVASAFNSSSTSSQTKTSTEDSPAGIIYVETARKVTVDKNTDQKDYSSKFDEARFLGELCRTSKQASSLLRGIVLWAPLDSGESLDTYLADARSAMGADVFDARVCGVRFLLDNCKEQGDFVKLMYESGGVDVLKKLRDLRSGRGLVFDLGVNARQTGIWQLESMHTLISIVRGRQVQGESLRGSENEQDGCTFVLNHLGKPSFDPADFEDWADAVSHLARHARVYVKLSGAFSELLPLKGESDSTPVYQRIKPWLDHVVKEFGAERIMFGSDWPVCNLGGPNESETWRLWHEVVQQCLADQCQSLDETSREKLLECVWGGTAIEAYKLDL